MIRNNSHSIFHFLGMLFNFLLFLFIDWFWIIEINKLILIIIHHLLYVLLIQFAHCLGFIFLFLFTFLCLCLLFTLWNAIFDNQACSKSKYDRASHYYEIVIWLFNILCLFLFEIPLFNIKVLRLRRSLKILWWMLL